MVCQRYEVARSNATLPGWDTSPLQVNYITGFVRRPQQIANTEYRIVHSFLTKLHTRNKGS